MKEFGGELICLKRREQLRGDGRCICMKATKLLEEGLSCIIGTQRTQTLLTTSLESLDDSQHILWRMLEINSTPPLTSVRPPVSPQRMNRAVINQRKELSWNYE
jgi:hypothetical protein